MSIETLIADAVAERVAAEMEPVLTAIAELRAMVENPKPPPPLSRKELAKHYAVSVRTVDGWVASGCPVQRLGGSGGSPRFDVGELDAWHRGKSVRVREAAE